MTHRDADLQHHSEKEFNSAILEPKFALLLMLSAIATILASIVYRFWFVGWGKVP